MCNTKIYVSQAVSYDMCSIFIAQCAMEAKFLFEDVDQLIADIKSTTVKSKIADKQIAALCCPPQHAVQNGEAG